MSGKTTNLPVFPLDLFLLPGGITRLRIFEPRYLKMVGLATQLGGFVISSNKQSTTQAYRWGSWVNIINFEQGKDGVLEIDVSCDCLVELENIQQDTDKLLFADALVHKHWSQKSSTTELASLSGSLKSLFESNKLLNELYHDKLPNNPYWTVSRWLELLPIPFDIKNKFVLESSYTEAKKLVHSIISQ
ncbi:LON peptidase substrate-binding domain-containing protein [Psychromonas sp. KJ10-2]|uniref:LON peptidase substrate-binding domain-containing protein n=1 Tax=Psychromonas sp. KJ10-2 TaxID=3391822 RepID=UPI0039B494DC